MRFAEVKGGGRRPEDTQQSASPGCFISNRDICFGLAPQPHHFLSLSRTPQSAKLVPMKLILKWLLSAAALLCVAYLYSGVVISSFGAAMIAAFVIGLFNMLLRPVLVVLTLPVTLVTLGLFLFVINALMFWSAAGILQGFYVRDFVAALWGSLLYSTLGLLIDSAFERLFPK